MTIRIKGINEIAETFNNIDNFSHWATPPMQKSVYLLHDEIANYPEKAKGAFSAMATPKQKRAYWARVSSGEISHGANGYVRTGNTGRKWTTDIIKSSNGIRGELGNNASHAIYVQSQADIQPFHAASGWATDESVIAKNEDKIMGYWEMAIEKILRGW